MFDAMNFEAFNHQVVLTAVFLAGWFMLANCKDTVRLVYAGPDHPSSHPAANVYCGHQRRLRDSRRGEAESSNVCLCEKGTA